MLYPRDAFIGQIVEIGYYYPDNHFWLSLAGRIGQVYGVREPGPYKGQPDDRIFCIAVKFNDGIIHSFKPMDLIPLTNKNDSEEDRQEVECLVIMADNSTHN